jgi:hypothetical protein
MSYFFIFFCLILSLERVIGEKIKKKFFSFQKIIYFSSQYDHVDFEYVIGFAPNPLDSFLDCLTDTLSYKGPIQANFFQKNFLSLYFGSIR